jgi:hypothetical protein
LALKIFRSAVYMARPERLAAIEALQTARGGTSVITYITSTRQQAEAQMAMDVIEPMYCHLQAVSSRSSETRIDLFIHSNGGDGIVPWRLVNLIREHCDHFTVLVPNRAFSAATLTALGADDVLMHPMGTLGPTDPTVTNPYNPPNPTMPGQLLGISVEDVASYIALVKEDVGISHDDELIQAFNTLSDRVHPLALGNVKRSTLQSRMMGEKLLRLRSEGKSLPDHMIEDIIRKLGSELYFHGHPINRREARDDVGLTFVRDAVPPVADAMWELYLLYQADMKLDQPFAPLQEAMAANPLPPAQPPGPANPTGAPNQTVVNLPGQRSAYVESLSRCDVHETDIEVVLLRDAQGNYSGSASVIRAAWTTE